MRICRNLLIAVGFWLCTLVLAGGASAQNYPDRPITVIMPFASGSASDVVSRIVFAKMSDILGQPMIVTNKPGAGGNLGTGFGCTVGTRWIHASGRGVRPNGGKSRPL